MQFKHCFTGTKQTSLAQHCYTASPQTSPTNQKTHLINNAKAKRFSRQCLSYTKQSSSILFMPF